MTVTAVQALLTTEDARHLGAANDPAGGVVVVQTAPGLRRRHQFGQDLLEALGVDPDLSGHGRFAEDDWEIITARFLAWNIRHLVVLDAPLLPQDIVLDVVALAAATDVDLWLIAEDPDDNYVDLVNAHAHTSTRLDAVEDLVTRLAPTLAGHAPVVPVRYPMVPSTNFTTFRAACRDRLDADAFSIVDATYRHAYADATIALTTLKKTANAVDEDSIVAYLRTVIDRCETTDEALVRVRAVQAAAFVNGYLVHIRLGRLLATMANAPAATVNSPATWERLGTYRAPYRAVTCALAAVGFYGDEILAVTIDDVTADGASVTRRRAGETATVAMPTGADVHLRTQRLLRIAQGAAGTDPLILNRYNKRPNRRYLVAALEAAARELGISVLNETLTAATPSTAQWRHRFGVAVQAL